MYFMSTHAVVLYYCVLHMCAYLLDVQLWTRSFYLTTLIHSAHGRLLSRLLNGTAPEPHELPSLLEPTALAATTSTTSTTSATLASFPAGGGLGGGGLGGGGLGGGGLGCGRVRHPVLPLTSRLLACYGLLCECARR